MYEDNSCCSVISLKAVFYSSIFHFFWHFSLAFSFVTFCAPSHQQFRKINKNPGQNRTPLVLSPVYFASKVACGAVKAADVFFQSEARAHSRTVSYRRSLTLERAVMSQLYSSISWLESFLRQKRFWSVWLILFATLCAAKRRTNWTWRACPAFAHPVSLRCATGAFRNEAFGTPVRRSPSGGWTASDEKRSGVTVYLKACFPGSAIHKLCENGCPTTQTRIASCYITLPQKYCQITFWLFLYELEKGPTYLCKPRKR